MSKSTLTLLTDLTANELRQRIAEHERVIAQWLAPYDPVTATMAWFDTLRAIEELHQLHSCRLGRRRRAADFRAAGAQRDEPA